jgi:hypothetical protein
MKKLCVTLLLYAKCENYMADILSEAGPAYHSRAPMFNPVLFWWGSCCSSFQCSLLCCVFFVLVLSRVCQIVHVSLNSPFLIVPSVLSGVYFNCIITRMCYMWWNDDDICFVLNQCIYMVARLNNNSQLNISLNSDTVATILSICSCSFIKRDPGI